MTDYTVADMSYNQDDEIEQFLLFWEDGEPDTRRATSENLLLYDPEDNLPFEGGLQNFFSGESALRLSDNPETVVSQSGDEYSYILSVGGNVVETTPEQAENLLEAIYTALTERNLNPVTELHSSILEKQVRRPVVNAIRRTFNESERIEIVANGWLVDGFYLVDWNAKLYSDNNDSDEGDYIREGGEAVKKDTSYEFIRLNQKMDVKPVTINIDGEQTVLTEREMLFLSKVTWLLDRQHYHPDEDFWAYTEQWANVPSETPDLDVFDI